ncbi:MAG: hypothetical protein KDE51_25510 [Anaerolineales bacterium]|nr:hypothetical protein [Anaerolineales bacterium]
MLNHEIELLQIVGGMIAAGTAFALMFISGRKLLSDLTGFDYVSSIWITVFCISAPLTAWFTWILFEYTGWIGILLIIGAMFGGKIRS